MPDERIVLTYDPAEAIAAAEKANRAIEANEKTATKAGQSIAKASEQQSRAIASMASDGLTAIERVAESARRKLALAVEVGGAAVALAKGGATLLAANGAQSVEAERLLTAYRALRLVMSPTIFTAMTLAAGAATQALVKLALSQADLVAQQARASVFAKQSFEDYRLTTLALERLGISTDDYSSASQKLQTSIEALSDDSLRPFGIDLEMLRARGLKSAAMLREIGAAAEDLSPFEKARLAVKLFGDSAEKNIGLLDGRVSRVRESFIAWGGKLTELEANELLKFRRGVDSIGEAFGRWGDAFSGAVSGIETRLAVAVAAIHNTVADIGVEIEEIKRTGKILSDDERRTEKQQRAEANRTPGEFREIAEGFNSKLQASRLPKFPETAGESSALQFASDFEKTLPGLQRALAKATAAREAALKLIGTEKGSLMQEGLAQELAARQKEINSLTAAVKGLQKAEQDAEAARKNIQAAYKELTLRQNALSTLADPRVQKVDLLKEADLAPVNSMYEKNFQKAQQVADQTAQMELANLREQLAQEDILYQGARDRQMQQLEGFQTRTVAQKIAVEQRKAEIEQEFLLKSFALKAQLLAADQEIELAKAEDNAELRAAINQKYALAGRSLTLQTEAAIATAGNEAVVKTAQILQDRGQRAFESVKNAADGLFDALVMRTRSWGDLLKNAVLLPALSLVKQLTTTAIASALTGVTPAGGAQTGGILSRLGFGGILNMGVARAGAPGGTPGFAGPVGGAGGLSGMLNGGGGFGGGAALGINAGALGLGAASLGLFGAFKAGQADSKALKSLSPAIGAISGLVGFGSLAYLFPSLLAAGPVGWVAAAAIGATIGLIGVFKKRGEDKLVEKIKSVYGITVDRSFAKNTLMPMIKDQFGGDIDLGIRSPIIRELLSVYRMQSNQTGIGTGLGAINNTARGVSLVGTGGGVFQNPVNVYGNSYGYGGVIPSSGAAQPFQTAASTPAVALTLQIDGRDIQASVTRTNQASNGRRETSAMLIEPLTIFG